MKKIIFVFLLATTSLTSATTTPYQKPLLVSDAVWADVQPYLMPADHPIKKKLDKLFKTRVLENEKSILKAGFSKATPGAFSHVIISENKKLKGYIFKFYSDEQAIEIEAEQWINRAFEAQSVQKAIETHGFTKYFKVPKKWIYPLPNNTKSKSAYPKSFILVAEKINIVRGRENVFKWRHEVKPKLLDAVYTITEYEGLIDSLVIHNLPFTSDNKLAFIDLEHHHKWPVPFYKLKRYLNQPMQDYWENLTHRQSKAN